MAVTIGHASIDENGKAHSGTAGDQNGKELCTRNWYSKPWTAVFRPKDSKVAEKIAVAMEQACANDKIGYDQYQRTTLYAQAQAVNWDLSKITVACECDCSSLVAVCVNAAGIRVSKDMYTGNEATVLNATGAFTSYTDSKYISGSAHLMRGDILLGKGHTAVVLSNTGGVTITTSAAATVTVDKAKSYDESLSGTYKVTGCTALNVRSGAGVGKRVLVAIKANTQVKNYGFYTSVLGTKWLYVKFTHNNVTYTGFASSKYLSKV